MFVAKIVGFIDHFLNKKENHMAKITPEKTHALLEQLAEYVMNEVAKKSEVDEIKKDVKNLQQKVDIIITGQDKQAKQLDDIRTEQVSTNSAILRHEERMTTLEQK